MLDLGFVVLLAAWSAGVGLWVLKRLGLVPERPWDALALAIPIGLGVLALAALGVGEAGALERGGMGVVLGLGGLVGLASASPFPPLQRGGRGGGPGTMLRWGFPGTRVMKSSVQGSHPTPPTPPLQGGES